MLGRVRLVLVVVKAYVVLWPAALHPVLAPRDGGAVDVGVLSTAEGIQLNSAFFAIPDPKLRRRILDLIRALAGQGDELEQAGNQAKSLDYGE